MRRFKRLLGRIRTSLGIMLCSGLIFLFLIRDWISRTFSVYSLRRLVERRLLLHPSFVNQLQKTDLLNVLYASKLHGARKRILLLHCQYGLGNRLRSVGSALALANRTDRLLCIYWPVDVHMKAAFHDLFTSWPTFLVPLAHLEATWPLVSKAWSGFDCYNYMEVDGHLALKNARIMVENDAHIYVKSAYVLRPKVQTELGAWIAQMSPSDNTLNIVSSVDLPWRDTVSVHVRGKQLHEEVGIDPQREYTGLGRKYIIDARLLSRNVSNFIMAMRQEVDSCGARRFFLTCDKADTKSKLRASFPNEVVSLPVTCESRSRHCMHYAHAEIILASKAFRFLGSAGSSFSQVIRLLGELHGQTTRMVGKDF